MVAIPQGLPGATEGPLRDLHAADHLIRRAVDVLERILHAVRVNGSFSISDAEEAAKNLLLSIEASDALLVAFFSAGTSSVNLAREAVNVCILSGKMGMELSYVPEKLRRVALAGFLSDVGLARVPAEILGKPGALTPDERAVVENHQRECAKLFQARGPEYTWLAEVFERRYKRTTWTARPRHRARRIRGHHPPRGYLRKPRPSSAVSPTPCDARGPRGDPPAGSAKFL